MKTPRPFRVLIIEDDQRAVMPLLEKKSYPPSNEYYFLDLLKSHEGKLPPENKVALEIYWSQTLDFSQTILAKSGKGYNSTIEYESVVLLSGTAPKGSKSAIISDSPELKATLIPLPKSGQNGKVDSFLQTMDVVILDLGGLSGFLPYLNDATVRQSFEKAGLICPENLAELSTTAKASFPGVYFYHAFRQQLKACQLVLALSAHDDAGANDEAPIRELLHPFCGVDNAPFTVKFGKDKVRTEAANATLHNRILSLFQDYCEGYTQLRHLGQIEEAAHHDYPVMIVGESGTGKEYVARSIHRRWLAERRRRDSKKAVPDNFVVVNCAGISPELARSELFGHVAGSFTGATDHRVGAILTACGCKGFKKSNDASKKKFTDATTEVAELAASVTQLATIAHDQQKLNHFLSQVVPALNKALEHEQNSLITMLRGARKKLENASQGDDLVQDYYTGMIEGNAHCFKPIKADNGDVEYLGVTFAEKQPTGTLFLDEFGDLPPDVQNLLLRFLEEKSGDIQPVGYPGRITGMKIRLILATSDPRIAKFAGFDLLGTHRSDHELKRSLRHDLLFRVKGQVIRTEAITKDTLLPALEEMVDRHSRYPWTSGAISCLAGEKGEIRMILNRLDDSNESGARVFGQRRELKRIIDLANSYMESAERRGLRLDSDKVTEAIVKNIWKPSELLMTGSATSSFAAKSAYSDGASTYNPLKPPLTTEEATLKQQVLPILGNNESLLDAHALQTQAQGLTENKRKELRKQLETGLGLTSARKVDKPKRYLAIGRLFGFTGQGEAPSTESQYEKQVGEWWRTQVFRNDKKTGKQGSKK